MRLLRFKFNVSSLLIGIAGLLTAGFLIAAAIDLWGYLRLEKNSMAKIEKWETVEKGSSQFAIKAYFSFETEGRLYQGKTTFSKPYHLNRISAEKQIKIYTERPWSVWYQSSHPEHSSIDRIFPFKKCLYSLMLLGIFFYFIFLHQRVHSQIAS